MVLMLLGALAVCSNSQTLPTPIGGYLGCFDLSKLQVDSVKVRAARMWCKKVQCMQQLNMLHLL
jgi:hypothetical protein